MRWNFKSHNKQLGTWGRSMTPHICRILFTHIVINPCLWVVSSCSATTTLTSHSLTHSPLIVHLHFASLHSSLVKHTYSTTFMTWSGLYTQMIYDFLFLELCNLVYIHTLQPVIRECSLLLTTIRAFLKSVANHSYVPWCPHHFSI